MARAYLDHASSSPLRPAALAADEALLNKPSDRSSEPGQQLTPVDKFTDAYVCKEVDRDPNRDRLAVG